MCNENLTKQHRRLNDAKAPMCPCDGLTCIPVKHTPGDGDYACSPQDLARARELWTQQHQIVTAIDPEGLGSAKDRTSLPEMDLHEMDRVIQVGVVAGVKISNR